MAHQQLTIVLCLPLVAVMFCCACGRTSNDARRELSLIVSGDTAGWIAPCGCTTSQSGGLARRATFVEHCRQTDDVLVCDVGGAPSGTSPYDLAKFTAILRGEVAMGLVAHNIGAGEAALGADELREAARSTRATLISTNTSDRQGHAIADRHVIANTSGLRVAVLGVLSPQFATETVRVADPTTAVLQALAGIQGEFDSAVVLAYLPTEELLALAQSLPEVDVVVGGPTIQTLEPRRVGPTLLAAVTNKGKFVARFRKSTEPWTCEIVELSPEWADDRSQTDNLARFRAELLKLDFQASDTSFGAQVLNQGRDDYRIAGSDACLACHANDCEAWRASKHAAAWASLHDDGAHGDPFCQQCHTTGYGMPGGFASVSRSQQRTNVGCESCHGPSQSHVANVASHTPFVARGECQRCHDRENSPQFDFDRYWSLVRHGAGQGE